MFCKFNKFHVSSKNCQKHKFSPLNSRPSCMDNFPFFPPTLFLSLKSLTTDAACKKRETHRDENFRPICRFMVDFKKGPALHVHFVVANASVYSLSLLLAHSHNSTLTKEYLCCC